jgi:hypothetical protein
MWQRRHVAAPSQKELEHHVEEIGWSLISLAKHLLMSIVADREGRAEPAQAAFDGAVLHLRALVEFLYDTRGGHIMASHFCPGWDVNAASGARNFDIKKLWDDLNTHAIHLSRLRFRQQPAAGYDIVPQAEELLNLFGDFLNCPGITLQKELFEQLTEARIHWARVTALR